MHPALIVLIVIASIVLLIALLLHSRIRVRVIYNEKTFSAYAYWLFLRFNLNSDDEDSSLLSEELLGNGLFQDETDKAVKRKENPSSSRGRSNASPASSVGSSTVFPTF